MSTVLQDFKAGSLNVRVFENNDLMGQAGAELVADRIQALLKEQPFVNMIFAAAPSQNSFLSALLAKDIDWNRVNAFHMDEYIGLPGDAPQSFGVFLKDRLFGKAPFKSVNYLNGNAGDKQQECLRYTQLLEANPTDIVCMGIGENGHIAFNDPPVANFKDTKLVKTVELDDMCRQQQVNDGCFDGFNDVPEFALTLTIPALMKAKYVYCFVPGERKAEAVKNTLTQEIIEKYPSTILRKQANAILFLDKQSSALI